jgi:hypothetical protein
MLVTLPSNTLNRYQNELILESSCQLIANAVSVQALELSDSWRDVIDLAMKKVEPSVQDAAAQAMRAVSTIQDCSSEVER